MQFKPFENQFDFEPKFDRFLTQSYMSLLALGSASCARASVNFLGSPLIAASIRSSLTLEIHYYSNLEILRKFINLGNCPKISSDSLIATRSPKRGKDQSKMFFLIQNRAKSCDQNL